MFHGKSSGLGQLCANAWQLAHEGRWSWFECGSRDRSPRQAPFPTSVHHLEGSKKAPRHPKIKIKTDSKGK
jgi:hypothetical protein